MRYDAILDPRSSIFNPRSSIFLGSFMRRNLIFRIPFALLIVCSAYFTDARSVFKSSALKFQSADNHAVPPAPTQRLDRFGVYNWNVNDSAFPRDGSIDLLNWGTNKVAELGSRTIRVFIGTLDIKQVYDVNPPGATELVQIAYHSCR
jgi:hypothetical protein